MKKILIGFGVILIGLILIGGIFGTTLWIHRNVAVSMEEKIDSQYVSNKNSYDSMWKSLKEMTQVTEMQAEQFKETYKGLIEGRYEDSNLLFKSIQEQNPQLNTNVYTDLQRQISANRTTFKNNQDKVIDIIREYNTYIKKHPIMVSITGRKEKYAKDYVVTSDRTEKAFDSGKDDEINLFDKE